MVRLIGFILIFVVFLTFIVLNLDNRCDISFGFKTIPQVPVFITAFSSFVFGLLFIVPFAITLGKRKRTGPPKPPKAYKDEADQVPGSDAGITGSKGISGGKGFE
jgi:hypothetical protein